MAQGLIAGSTNYDEQSILDIKSDIENWISYSFKIRNFFETTIEELKIQDYWDSKVPYNFQTFCIGVPKICETFCSDFEIILDSIKNDRITQREINLMKKIYKVSKESEEYSWKSFKDKNDGYWHEHGNPLFKKVERMYAKGRDYFVTLKDVGNAVSRMEDYMTDEKSVVDNSVHNDHSIHIGNDNKIKGSIIGNAITNNPEKKQSFWSRFWLPLLITIVGGVICTGICFYLKWT